MRVNKWGIGAALLAVTMLVGCSASEKPASTPASSASPAAEAAAAPKGCPELKQGATVDGAELGTCVATRSSTLAGYAATTTALGVASKTRFNPAEKALESISPAGSLIVVDGVAYVKSATSSWQKADPASSDPVIAGLSAVTTNLSSLDPIAVAGMMNGTFTVTGEGTRLDRPVFILTGTVQNQGLSTDAVYELTADYGVLAVTSATEVNGTKVGVTMEVTQWDVKQDIVAPL